MACFKSLAYLPPTSLPPHLFPFLHPSPVLSPMSRHPSPIGTTVVLVLALYPTPLSSITTLAS